ncbi:UvrABC system protein A [bioreactor metagenome]|uniref:UvrABC system protein A n=1 Tax=bioreactor metagenome TaxID=1076179 RepID=A0A645BBJ2_9ZZZZ
MGVIFISKSYYCEGCGGVMEFNAIAQALKCPNCGTEVEIENNPEDVIEHNLDVIKTADYIIDMGPEGGFGGGTIIATGTPEEIAKNKNSYTGIYLNKVLNPDVY